MMNNVDKDRS